jgi:predicted kinase
MEPIFIMLVGIPGSGKSSWLNQLVPLPTFNNTRYVAFKDMPFAVVCPDEVRRQFGNVSDQSNNRKVWVYVYADVKKFLEDGINVILDATNVTTRTRKEFMLGLPKCKKMARVFTIDPEEAYKRVRLDINSGKDRSDVPKEVIDRMYRKFQHTITVLESEGFELI